MSSRGARADWRSHPPRAWPERPGGASAESGRRLACCAYRRSLLVSGPWPVRGGSGAGASRAKAPRPSSSRRWARRRDPLRRRTPRADHAARRSTRSSSGRPRVEPPASLAHLCTTDPFERAGHTYGKSFRDIWRALAPRLLAPARPRRDPAERGRHRRRCSTGAPTRASPRSPTAAARRSSAASSATSASDYRGAVRSTCAPSTACSKSIARRARRASRPASTARRSRTSSARTASRCATSRSRSSSRRSAAGSRPARAVTTPRCTRTSTTSSSRSARSRRAASGRAGRLPGSGAGPSPDRMLFGSEGILGVITEAWMRLQDRPTFRASATARFADFAAGAAAARARSRRAGLYPANCRLLDPVEAHSPGTDDSGRRDPAARVRVGRPSARRVDRARRRVRARPRRRVADERSSSRRRARAQKARRATGATRSSARRTHATRSSALGVISETFETACTWDRFDALHERRDRRPSLDTAEAAGAWPAVVTCRFTHVYPDGPAPYFTVLALGTEPEQLAQWEAIKAAAGDAIAALRRHDHAPPRRRPRPPPLVRPAAPGAVRGRAARRQAGARPGRDPQPRRADRSVSVSAP